MPKKPITQEQLLLELEDLRARLDEAEETLRVFRSGEVDALIVPGAHGEQIFTLKGADHSYRILIEDMSEGALTLTAEGVILYANRRFAEMLKTPLEKVIGSTIHTWIAPDSQRILQSLLRKGADGKRREQLILTAGDGTQVPVNLSVSNPLVNEMPDYFCLVATDLTEQKRSNAIAASEKLAQGLLAASNQSRLELLREIEARKRTEEALRNSEALLVEAQAVAKFGNWEYDVAEDKFTWSKEMFRIFDLNSALGEPKWIEHLQNIHPDDFERIDQAERDAIENGRSYREEFRILLRDGSIVWAETIGKIHRSESGKISKLSGTIQDITERKRMESQLNQSQKMESIGTLAGGIAHDFNNILAIIIGNTEMAIDAVPEWNPAREYLNDIQSASTRAKDLIRHILSFSRKGSTYRKPIKLGPIIEDSLKLLRATIPADIEILQNLSCESDRILAEPTQIGQVLMNLCTNAAHAMHDKGGILEVSFQNVEFKKQNMEFDLGPGRYVKLTLSDTGHGIDPKVIDRIFDPYFTTKGLGKGTGLGLSMVQGIVKMHDGAVAVKSELGKGSVFEVLFPLTEAASQPENEKAEAFPTGNEKILLIDDEESILKLAKKRLEMQGYQVEAKNNPVEALELFRSEPDRFDLIITDMTMPKMTGDKLAKELFNIRPAMPIILCSGYSDRTDAEKAAAFGIRQYIEKPLNMSSFMISIRKVLDEAKAKSCD